MKSVVALGLWFFTLFVSTSTFADEHKPPVRFLVLETWSMPFGLLEKVKGQTVLTGGVTKEWQEALAAELGRSMEVVIAPYKRLSVMVEMHEADIQCFTAPEWVDAEQYEWPEPYFSVDEQLVGHQKQASIISLDDLNGKSIGTVSGYHYPTLDPLFESKRLVREDAPTEESAYQKQIYRRVDYTVMRSADFRYRKKMDSAATDLVLSPLVINHTPIYCARIKGATVSLKELKEAQKRLITKKRFENLLSKYF